MATVATIPQTTLSAGAHVFGPASVASTVAQFLLVLDQVSWPHAGDLGFSYTCDVSLDGGATWLSPSPSSGTEEDAAIPSKNGFPANQIRIGCDIAGVGNANRKIRFSTNFAKSLTVSGTLQAF